jgi:hypothetical protein
MSSGIRRVIENRGTIKSADFKHFKSSWTYPILPLSDNEGFGTETWVEIFLGIFLKLPTSFPLVA